MVQKSKKVSRTIQSQTRFGEFLILSHGWVRFTDGDVTRSEHLVCTFFARGSTIKNKVCHTSFGQMSASAQLFITNPFLLLPLNTIIANLAPLIVCD
jgi:hypothetical protein